MGRGRPPLGKQAMSSAERQRRYLARIRGTGKPAPTDTSKVQAETAALKAEIATLKRRVREQDSKIAELEKLAARAEQVVREQGGTLQKAQPHKPSAAEDRCVRLEARVRELETLVLPLDETGKDAVRQHKRKIDREFKARVRKYEKTIRERTWVMDEKAYRTILAGLHPEASKEIRDRARNLFERYRKHVLTKEDMIEWPPPTD
jgi:SMC interacting uncharacterized protein involved in chromosome segregation